MGAVPTVRIVSPKDANRFWRINSRDLDPQRHTIWPGLQEDASPKGDRHHLNADARTLSELQHRLPEMPRGELLRIAATLGLQLDRRFRVQRLREELAERVSSMLQDAPAADTETRS